MNFPLIFVLLPIIVSLGEESPPENFSLVLELAREVGNMKATLGEQATTLNQQALEIENLKDDLQQCTRATTAFMTFMSETNVVFPVDQNIVFTDVRLNVGYHYNPRTGVFQAPESGTYHFSLTLANNNVIGTLYNAYIVAGDGNRVLGYVYQSDNWVSWQARTVSVVAHLDAGENVWIKCRSSPCSIAHTIHSCFSGFLVDGR
ncbi:hypothetical protein CHS0354_022496 [Potamilus streckersoni]|uniref:C1q domain-containing protein n=1 Tax=Potamilus streckersoni TaxID=2493646 RepID=A0AAE0W3A2_9BIVA|nr:hypothetical protein CHS0354_022496 [Potamilus streckersoni]